MKNPWKHLSKVNPQREKGRREIANDVFMALIKADLTAGEYKYALFVIHRTWGFNRHSDKISKHEFRQATGLSLRTLKRIRAEMKKRRFVYFEPFGGSSSGRGGAPVTPGSSMTPPKGGTSMTPPNEYLFNKHYDTWLKRHKTGGVTRVPPRGVTYVPPLKERSLKETPPPKERDDGFGKVRVNILLTWNRLALRRGWRVLKRLPQELKDEFEQSNPEDVLIAIDNYGTLFAWAMKEPNVFPFVPRAFTLGEFLRKDCVSKFVDLESAVERFSHREAAIPEELRHYMAEVRKRRQKAGPQSLET